MVNQHSGADEHSTRMLTDRDLPPRVRKLLDTDPIDHVFVAARVEQYGLEPWRLGCPVWGATSSVRIWCPCCTRAPTWCR